MAFDPKDERIGDLERNLYSRDAKDITAKDRPDLTPRPKSSDYGWKTEENRQTAEDFDMVDTHKKSSFVTKIFMASVLFFMVAAGIAAYIIVGGVNVISSKNVDITVQGLISVAAGEELSLDITVKNNNNTALESGTIYVEYPDGTRMPADVTQDLVRDQIAFEEVPAGGTVTKTVKALFFGEKDSIQQIKITAEYKAQGSNANFSKVKTYDITIKSSPVLMEVSVPEEVNAGQEIAITIDAASNSSTIVQDVLVKVEYPFGFTFLGSTPKVSFDKNIWQLGDLSPLDEKKIVIRGRMDGQNEEERTFRFLIGTAGADEKVLAVNYIATQKSLFIKKSFLSLDLELNGDPSPYLAEAGEKIQGRLTWKNNLAIAINSASIQVKLSGRGLDRSEVTTGAGGFFRSSDNTLNWDRNSLPALQNIEPGETGSVTFTVGTLPATQQLLAQGRNLDVVLDTIAKGTRIQGGAPQEITSTVSAVAKVMTGIIANGRVVYSNGPFSNTGTLPPRADRETTYAVIWNLSNSFNDAADVSLSTVLPPYVNWVGTVSPASEQVTYDESTRTVTWNVPDLRAGIGYTSPSKEVAFKIGLLPSLSQVGTVPDLTGSLLLSGTDRFTGAEVEGSKPALTTRLTTDPVFRNGDDRVAQ